MTVEAVGQPAHRRNSKETSETIKNWIDILKSILAFVVLSALLFLVGCDREKLAAMAREMGISKVSGPGVEIALGATDALPRNEAALKAAETQIQTLQTQYSTAVEALRQMQPRLASSDSPLPPEAQRNVAAVLQRAPETLRSSERTAEALSEARDKTKSVIARLPGAGDSSLGYGVVFGGDRSESEGRDQLKRAQGLAGTPKLFRREGFYRSVVVFSDRDAATAALPRIKAINPYAATAYVVTLASWCPGADLSEDPVACPS